MNLFLVENFHLFTYGSLSQLFFGGSELAESLFFPLGPQASNRRVT